MANTFDELKGSYPPLFEGMAILPDRIDDADRIIDRIVAAKAVYQAVMEATRVPWQVVGIIHNLEASGNMTRHLHNGDPLTARTTHVPAGRPVQGTPPFTFAESAADALQMHHLDEVPEWTLERILYECERYNGFGYRGRNVNSPYLWSFSNRYTKGKYVADGHFDPEAVSQQCGAAVLLRRMVDRNILSLASQMRSATVDSPNGSFPAIYWQGSVWVPVRKAADVVGKFRIDALRMEPFTVTVANEAHAATLDATLVGGTGYVRARDLFDHFLGMRLTFDPATAVLTVTQPRTIAPEAIVALQNRMREAIVAGDVAQLETVLTDAKALAVGP